MTIITKPSVEKKQVKPLLVTDSVHHGPDAVTIGGGTNIDGCDVEMWLSPSTRRRISATTTVCIFVTALIVMSAGIIGGVYLYRQAAQHQHMSRFRGWCGIPYERDSLIFSRKHTVLGPNRKFFRPESNAEWDPPSHLFREEFDLDLDTGLFEKISIPDFGLGRNAQFLHDFKSNKTGIIFHELKKCYVLPLDRAHVKPPRHLFDLVRKMWMGYYDVDTTVLRRRLMVLPTPLTHLAKESEYIADECGSFSAYMLKEDSNDRKRRSVPSENELVVVEFAGENILELTIATNE